MRSSYRKIGDFIKQSKLKNEDGVIDLLLGVNLDKKFMPSVANINGVDLTKYKVIKKGQFGCKLMSVGRDKKVPVSRLTSYDEAIISSAYFVFEVIDENELNPEYLMMWFSRSESDRFQWFQSGADIRGRITWEEFCSLPIKVPSIENQREIVKEYNTIVKRIKLNEQLNQKLEETAQALYKHWFVDFEFPDKDGQPYKSSGGEMVYNEELDQEIPKEFSCKSIGEYSPVKSGYAFKSEWWKTEGIPVIKIGSIQNNTVGFDALGYVDDDKINTAKKYITNSGSIVIAMTGATIGKIGIIPKLSPTILVNQRVGMFDLGQNPITKTPFLFLTLLTDYVINEIKNVGGDSAQANISSTQIEEIKILYPSVEIIIQFNRILSPAFEAYLSRIEENKFLNELTDIVLSKMSTVESQKTKMAL